MKKWNLMESVILLDNFFKTLNGRMSRKEIIKLTSNELRRLALKQGIEFDDVFRNVNIESACYGYTIVKPASKLFVETVDLNNSDKDEFAYMLNKEEE